MKNFETSVLTANSRYLQTAALKFFKRYCGQLLKYHLDDCPRRRKIMRGPAATLLQRRLSRRNCLVALLLIIGHDITRVKITILKIYTMA